MLAVLVLLNTIAKKLALFSLNLLLFSMRTIDNHSCLVFNERCSKHIYPFMA